MSLAFRLKMAKQKGEACAKEQGYTALPVDPFAIAAKNDIEVKGKPDAAEGVSGMLLRHGNAFGILYATHLDNEGFQRFSVAHELAHYFLEGHIDHVLPKDGAHVSEAGFTSADPYEMEADQFAAGLLMPGDLFKRELSKRDAGLATVEAMAGLCRTSLTATGIRCAELSPDALAIIISTASVVDFCFLSNAMKSLPQLSWIRKGTPVPAPTLTARFNANRRRVLCAERETQETDVMDWLGGSLSAVVAEEVVGLGRYGKTLTVLSSVSIGQAQRGFDDYDEEQDLAEKWTPRFRR
jgi:IrrE N-terminal-like domain